MLTIFLLYYLVECALVILSSYVCARHSFHWQLSSLEIPTDSVASLLKLASFPMHSTPAIYTLATTMAVHISFTYWVGGEHHMELNLLTNGQVVFQSHEDHDVWTQEPRGRPHGNWSLGENAEIVVAFDYQARPECIKLHVFERLNLMVNVYKLIKRDGQDIPNCLHKHRALLILNSNMPRRAPMDRPA